LIKNNSNLIILFKNNNNLILFKNLYNKYWILLNKNMNL